VADHELVILSLGNTTRTEDPVVKYVRNYGSIDLPTLEAELPHLDWTWVFLSADIDSKVEHFNFLLSDLLEKFVPLQLVTYMESATVDGDPELQLLVERREIAYFLWRLRPNRRSGDRFWRKFHRISDLVAKIEELLERHCISTKFESSRPLKHLWRVLNDERIGRHSL
jgi:hypothetical protein